MCLTTVHLTWSVISCLVLVDDQYCDHKEESCESTVLDTYSHGGVHTLQVRKLQDFMGTTLDEDTLRDFPVLRDGQVSKIDIPNEIGSSFMEKFGTTLLGLEKANTVDEIMKNKIEIANEMFIWEWFKGNGKQPVTLAMLVSMLQKIDLDELAEILATTGTVLNIMDKPYIPILAKEYSRELAMKYENDFVVDSHLWLPKRLSGQKISFIPLELKKKGNIVLLEELVSSFRAGTRVLLVGRPGSGKSTIIRHLSKILVQRNIFNLVVRLYLGNNPRIDSLATLLSASSYSSYSFNDMNIITSYIERTQGEGACFLLDGYDEYLHTDSGFDFVQDFIENTAKLDKAVVMVTSRPSAAEDVEASFDHLIDIIGFGEESINKYIKHLNISQIEGETIHQYLDTHPNVHQLCYLPLHLSMLVYIALDTIESGVLAIGDTETQLYTDFLFLTMFESIRHSDRAIHSLKDCLDSNIELCLQLRSISEIAFEGMLKGEQFFFSMSLRRLPEYIDVPAKLESLNLFEIEKNYQNISQRSELPLHKYSYSHPTFQEFLTAFHLTILPVEDQLKYMFDLKKDVYKFLLGLISKELEYNDEVVLQTFSSIGYQLLALDNDQKLFIMKCANEIGHQPAFISYLKDVGIISSTNSLHLDTDSVHDCWYIGYVLTLSPLSELVISSSDLVTCIRYITRYLNYYPTLFKSINISKLALDYMLPWYTIIENEVSTKDHFLFLAALQNDLTDLQLNFFTFINNKTISELGKILRCFTKLKSLNLKINVSSIIEGHIESNLQDLPHLQHLELDIVNVDDDDTIIPDNLLEYINLGQIQSFTFHLCWNKDVQLRCQPNITHWRIDKTE